MNQREALRDSKGDAHPVTMTTFLSNLVLCKDKQNPSSFHGKVFIVEQNFYKMLQKAKLEIYGT